ncbi:glycoside hydrolase family 25 protein [Bergeyella zoohelcum]|nr:glycoside hydrolase family 25 protein [Bergeyella zoohelcum]
MKAKKNSSTRKKRQKVRKKNFLLKRYVLLLVFGLALLVTGLYMKQKISYFYALYFNKFQHKILKNSPAEEKRIEKIVTQYADNAFGIDISHYQEIKDIQWDSLSIGHRTIPLSFVVMRASMGNKSKDKNFKHFWKQAGKHHLIRGAYHFYRPDQDPVLQANNFLESVQLEKGDLAPVLDIEKSPIKITQEKLIENLKIWLKIVEEKYGKKPIIYTYYHYHKDYLEGNFDEYPLWLANYNDVPEPSPNSDWKIWQFTEKGIVYGINTKVDLNVVNGGKSVLKKLMVE